MLLSTIGLWALNLTVSRYILTHGFQPLAYSSTRYGLAAADLRRPRRSRSSARCGSRVVTSVSRRRRQPSSTSTRSRSSTRSSGRPPPCSGSSSARRRSSPGCSGSLRESSRRRRASGLGALLSFAGVALVALGSGGELSGDLGGVLLGVLTAATWAAYSILVTPLMRRHSATHDQRRRARARVGPDHPDRDPAALEPGLEPRLARSGSSSPSQSLGPLVVTNELWFRALDRIGAARATLAANLQPFLAAAIAVVLLSETLAAVRAARAAS